MRRLMLSLTLLPLAGLAVKIVASYSLSPYCVAKRSANWRGSSGMAALTSATHSGAMTSGGKSGQGK